MNKNKLDEIGKEPPKIFNKITDVIYEFGSRYRKFQ